MTWRYVRPITHYQKGTEHIPQYLSERFSGTVAISPPIISVYYRQAPNWGREFFFREAVLPLMYRCKGGRSPNSARVRNTLRHLAHGIQRLVSGECQARCLLADVLCISVITQIYSWNWPNRRAHFRWTGNETAVARTVRSRSTWS